MALASVRRVLKQKLCSHIFKRAIVYALPQAIGTTSHGYDPELTQEAPCPKHTFKGHFPSLVFNLPLPRQ